MVRAWIPLSVWNVWCLVMPVVVIMAGYLPTLSMNLMLPIRSILWRLLAKQKTIPTITGTTNFSKWWKNKATKLLIPALDMMTI